MNPKPVYIDWMNPATGEIILVGKYDSITEAADAIGVSYNAVWGCIKRGGVLSSCGCMVHYGTPDPNGMICYVTLG